MIARPDSKRLAIAIGLTALFVLTGLAVISLFGFERHVLVGNDIAPEAPLGDRPAGIWFTPEQQLVVVGENPDRNTVIVTVLTPPAMEPELQEPVTLPRQVRRAGVAEGHGGSGSSFPPYGVSADGRRIAWVSDGNLYEKRLDTRKSVPEATSLEPGEVVDVVVADGPGQNSLNAILVVYSDGKLRRVPTIVEGQGAHIHGRRLASRPYLVYGSRELQMIYVGGGHSSLSFTNYAAYGVPFTAAQALASKEPIVGTENGAVCRRVEGQGWPCSDGFGGAVRALTLFGQNQILVGGDFDGIHLLDLQLKSPRLVESSTNTRLLAASSEYLAYGTDEFVRYMTVDERLRPKSWVTSPPFWMSLLIGWAGLVLAVLTLPRTPPTGPPIEKAGPPRPTTEPGGSGGSAESVDARRPVTVPSVADSSPSLEPVRSTPVDSPRPWRGSVSEESSHDKEPPWPRGELFPPGTILGGCEILSLLKRGGMGVVYRAKELDLEREVALKVPSVEMAEEPRALRRFAREAKSTAKLSHPNIRAVYRVGRDKGIPYVVMELLQGETLEERIASTHVDLRETLFIARGVVAGLVEAHGKNVIHRDIKPANIFLTEDDGVKIVDFGVARYSSTGTGEREQTLTRLTVNGAFVGTPTYASPEQFRGRSISDRTDIFSFGCVFYEMLAGRPPFTGRTLADTSAAILRDRPKDLTDLRSSLPVELNRIIRLCLEKEARQRPSAEELLEELDGLDMARTLQNANKLYDAFICHASEDKAFVAPLAKALVQRGLNIWYDEFRLQPGDRLAASIDDGLARCRIGIVVVSPAFLESRWAKRELAGLVAQELEGEAVIVPIRHGISGEALRKFSPPLADKVALKSADGPARVAEAIAARLGAQEVQVDELQLSIVLLRRGFPRAATAVAARHLADSLRAFIAAGPAGTRPRAVRKQSLRRLIQVLREQDPTLPARFNDSDLNRMVRIANGAAHSSIEIDPDAAKWFVEMVGSLTKSLGV